MTTTLKICSSALILLGLSACAVSPNPPGVADVDIDAVEVGDEQMQTRYVTVTGSRIRHRVSDDGSAPLTSLPIVGYSHDDIEFTGVRNMQGALMILDPRID